MNDASLDYGVGESLRPVDDGQKNILGAAVPELVHYAQPELGALVLLEPEPQDLLCAVAANAQRNVNSLVAYDPFVADLDAQGVEEDQRIDAL